MRIGSEREKNQTLSSDQFGTSVQEFDVRIINTENECASNLSNNEYIEDILDYIIDNRLADPAKI